MQPIAVLLDRLITAGTSLSRIRGRLGIYYRCFGLRHGPVLFARSLSRRRGTFEAEVTWKGVVNPIRIRVDSSDIDTFHEIFVGGEYQFPLPDKPFTIVDAGANIGLASLYFSSRFPESTIVAIEPERSNFDLLVRNTAALPNVRPVHGALWSRDCDLQIVDPGLGAWALRTIAAPPTARCGSARCGSARSVETPLAASGGLDDPGVSGPADISTAHPSEIVKGLTITQLLDSFNLKYIDLLKVDIEGAETEVFRDPSAWIDRVGSIIIELHDRLVPGCTRTFFRAVEDLPVEILGGSSTWLVTRKPLMDSEVSS